MLDLLKENNIGSSTAAFRTRYFFEFQNEGLFNQGFKMEDYPLWLFISEKSKIHYINECTTTYRVRKESESHSSNRYKSLIFFFAVVQVRLFFSKRNHLLGSLATGLQKQYRIFFDIGFQHLSMEIVKPSYAFLKEQKKITSVDRLKYLLCNVPLLVKLYRKIKYTFYPN